MRAVARIVASLALPLALVAVDAAAQQAAYPSKPVRLVIPFAPGASTDILSRLAADELSRRLGQPFVSENVTGAGGTIGTGQVAKAAPDGYTLMMVAANHVINASLYRSLPYDAVRDFRGIARIGQASFVLCANPALPAKTLPELVAYARQNPGKVNYSSPGNGTPGHLAMEMLKTQGGINIVHVPYKGAAQATTDLIGGQVQVGFVVESSAIPQIKAGKLVPLAISSAARSANLPEVPTVAESGFPGFDVVSWIGLAGPAAMPDALVDSIGAAVLKILANPEVTAKIAATGITPVPAGPAVFGPYIASEHGKWAKAVKDSGATLD